MELKIVKYDPIIQNLDFYKTQIPKAQNSEEKYYEDVINYYLKHLKTTDSFLINLLDSGEIVSLAFVRFYEEENKWFLVNVNTRKDFQNKHCATKMLNFGLNHFFKEHPKENLYLWVGKQNEYAKKLYKNLGFKQTDYFPQNLDFLKGQEEKEKIFTLDLKMFKEKQKSVDKSLI